MNTQDIPLPEGIQPDPPGVCLELRESLLASERSAPGHHLRDIPLPSFWRRPPKLAKDLRRQVSREFAYRVMYLIAKTILLLGVDRATRWAGCLGELGFLLQRRDRQITLKNLKDCLGESTTEEERRAIAKRMFANVGYAVAETIWMSRWDELLGHLEFEVEGRENLEAALARGKGVICPNGHFGNWEVMSAWVAQSGYPGNIITRKIKDPRLDRWLNRVRENLSVGLVPRGKSPLQMIRVLKTGGILGVMIDLDTRSARGIFVDFFGKPAYTQSGPFQLARRTGASIVPALCFRTGKNRLKFHFGEAWQVEETDNPEEDVRRATERATRYLEDQIRLHPDQWTWFHKRWKTRPGSVRLRLED